MLISHDTPVGTLTLGASGTGLTICSFRSARPVTRRYPDASAAAQDGPAARRWLETAWRELDAYFGGRLRDFTVPADLCLASAFDRQVLGDLAAVGYGHTTTYGRLAESLGLPRGSAYDVGQALAHNPVMIIVPCHRVLAADGGLTGYAGGLPAKRWLLDLESAETTPRLDIAV
jgi:methylated-DNA-[protein]-cysteine S-methyltransferase